MGSSLESQVELTDENMTDMDELAELLDESVSLGRKEEDKYEYLKPDGESSRDVPIELLSEFVSCIVDKKYTDSLKLCNFILLYDKDHELANKYSPLLRRAVMEIENKQSESDDLESETE